MVGLRRRCNARADVYLPSAGCRKRALSINGARAVFESTARTVRQRFFVGSVLAGARVTIGVTGRYLIWPAGTISVFSF
jgi:hypothetical protein